jgi:four helix bundle protein
MEITKSFKDLIVWQKAHLMVLEIYAVTKSFPKEETFGLTSQMRRAGVSIAANIAEGYKKKTKPNKLNFLNIAEGSLEEIKYYLVLARDLEYIKNEKFIPLESLSNEIGKLLNGYYNAIQKK